MSDLSPAEKFRIALDMYEVGEQMQEMRLRRESPSSTPDEIRAALDTWRLSRPSAPYGDAVGRVRRPRR